MEAHKKDIPQFEKQSHTSQKASQKIEKQSQTTATNISNTKQDNPNQEHLNSNTMINPFLPAVTENTPNSTAAAPDNVCPPIVGKVVDPSHFPTQLYKMLEDIDNSSGAAAELANGEDAFSSVVSWQPHGKCLLIHDEDKFSKYVLPKYFCRLKFTSFQRQLHFHGFKRLCKQGPDKGAYYHELFNRGFPELATYIQRVKSTKGMRGRKRKSQDQEPDFYKQGTLNIQEAIARATACDSNSAPGSPTPTQQRATEIRNFQAPAPLSSLTGGMPDISRLEPTPVAPLTQRPTRREFFAESKQADSDRDLFNEKLSDHFELSSVQQLLQTRDNSFRFPNALNLSTRRSSLLSISGDAGNNNRSDHELWQFGLFQDLDRSSNEAASSTPLTDLDIPANSQHCQGQTQLPSLESQQYQLRHLQQQRAEMEDQMQQHIMRQMEEQRRQQQPQQQSFQMQQGQTMPSMSDLFSMQQQQNQFQQPQQQSSDALFESGLLQQHQDELMQQQSYGGSSDFEPFLLDTYC